MRRWNVSPVLLAVLACFTALSLGAPRASAEGFDLRWNSCASDGGAANENFACDTDAGTHLLVGSFQLDQPITGLVFVEVVLDFIVADHLTVSPWWEFFDCHAGALYADAAIYPSASNCSDWSGGSGVGGLIGWNHGGSIAPADTASHRRIVVAAAVDVPGVNLAANTDYFLFTVNIDNINTTDPGSCAGCTQPVCVVLNSMRFTTTAAQVTTLTSARVAGGNFATWQGGAGASCASVPVKRATWGAVKALYR